MTVDARVERSRQAVHAAVCEVLVAEGLAGLTVDRLADVSGISRSTIYRNWPDLAALACVAFEELMHREAVALPADPQQAITAYLEDYARRLNDPTYLAVLIALIEGSRRDEAFAAVHRAHFSQTRSRAGELIRSGQAAGIIDPSLDVQIGVEELVAPFLYRRLVTQAEIGPAQIAELAQRLIGAWSPPSTKDFARDEPS